MKMMRQAVLSLPLLALAANAQGVAGPYAQCKENTNAKGRTFLTAMQAEAWAIADLPFALLATAARQASEWNTASAWRGQRQPLIISYSPYYAQCTPGANQASPTPTAATSAASQPAITGSPVVNTATPVGGGVPTTLVSPWIWIRAVEAPNFHSYLQAKPTLAPGPAYMDTYTKAGQFQVEDGQLVMNTGPSGTPLYMNVEDPADKTQRALHTYFNTTKNTYGTFSFSGDALQWSVADINRPNLSAWYVCGSQELYINTGAYAYNAPSGCADETVSFLSFSWLDFLRLTCTQIHFYNGATAVD
jgi:hypothetical protein